MNTLYILTLEPIEKRYTKQWHNYFKKEFKKYIKKVVYIDGTIQNDIIKNGRFLDINQTNIWKSEQIISIAKLFQKNKIKQNDYFLFLDGWHFGITALKYMSQLNKIQIKIFAYWHAGTWDPNDFITQAGLRTWAKNNEKGWLEACDKHFVATNYHKELIQKYFKDKSISNKIYVIGFPMDWQKETSIVKIKNKENLIIFPHRIDKEKQPDKFIALLNKLSKFKGEITITKTKTKKEYYNILAKSKYCFSANLQETFGIGTVEATMFNVIPIVPDRLSYVELYDKKFRYKKLSDVPKLINKIELNKKSYLDTLKKNRATIINTSNNSIKKMAELMK